MKLTLSPTFAAAQAAHVAAYAIHDVFAEAGDDGVKLGGTAEADAASDEEYRTLDVMMTTLASAPGDVIVKIQKYLERAMYSWDGPRNPIAYKTYADAFIADLLAMARPTPSPAMVAAFDEWALWQHAFDAVQEKADVTDLDLHDIPEYLAWTNHSEAAFKALMAVPVVNPGDFMVKWYVYRREFDGGVPGGYRFLIKTANEMADIIAGYDHMAADFEASDLGRCICALGRTDFDAKAWVDAALGVGHKFYVTVDVGANNEQTLWQSPDAPDGASEADTRRFRLLEALINDSPDNKARKQACADYIVKTGLPGLTCRADAVAA